MYTYIYECYERTWDVEYIWRYYIHTNAYIICNTFFVYLEMRGDALALKEEAEVDWKTDQEVPLRCQTLGLTIPPDTNHIPS